MSLKDIASLGKMLARFLHLFRGCFCRSAGRFMLVAYVRGLLSNIQWENAEAIARDQNFPLRTLQRFLESIVWDEGLPRDECQRLIAAEHAHPDAIGCVDETGTTKSANHTAGVKRQYNGNGGKVDNCINNVALSYTSNDFHCLLDSQLYLPKEWCDDPVRRKNYIPDDIEFKTKPQIALDLIDRAKVNGIWAKAWTFGELYGRDGHFLHGRSMIAVKPSSAKCRRIFTHGLISLKYLKNQVNFAVDARNDIRA